MLHVKLYWLRETGRDAGSVIRADQLEPEIGGRVAALAGEDTEIELRLPYLDKREWRRRGEILNGLALERCENVIRCILPPQNAVRNLAAHLVHEHPAWMTTPSENSEEFFPVWQRVSVALQESLRSWIPAEYFHSASCYENREAAFPMLVYQVARVFPGRPRTEFTYDLRDFPECPTTLALAWKLVGRSLQTVMAGIEQQLYHAGMPALGRRYAPIWHQDVLMAVRKKPKPFAALLAVESMLINAVIDLGSDRSAASINRFTRTANQALRNVHGMDLRKLGVRVLEETTLVLSGSTGFSL